MKRLFVLAVLLLACHAPRQHGVTIARTGKASARVLVTTIGVAIKETGPVETVKQFGEVYAFSPEVFAVRRDQPTQITSPAIPTATSPSASASTTASAPRWREWKARSRSLPWCAPFPICD